MSSQIAEIEHFITWFDSSPDVDQPDCICSLDECAALIVDTAIRIWNKKGQEARFHINCYAKLPSKPGGGGRRLMGAIE